MDQIGARFDQIRTNLAHIWPTSMNVGQVWSKSAAGKRRLLKQCSGAYLSSIVGAFVHRLARRRVVQEYSFSILVAASAGLPWIYIRPKFAQSTEMQPCTELATGDPSKSYGASSHLAGPSEVFGPDGITKFHRFSDVALVRTLLDLPKRIPPWPAKFGGVWPMLPPNLSRG